MRKKIFVFLGDVSDRKRVFETIRMSLGITLRGNLVYLYISPSVMKSISDYEEKIRSEIHEFLQAVQDMGSQYAVKNFDDINSDEISNFDACIIVV